MPRFNPRGSRTTRSTRRLAAGAAAVASVALLAAPGAALAGDAYIDGGGLPRYTANFGEDNNLRVAELPHPDNPNLKVVRFRDTVAVKAGNGCASAGTFAADCSVPLSVSFARADLATLEDRIEPDLVNPPTTVGFSAEGNGARDVLGGSAQRDILHGGDGPDSIVGRGGNDHLEGDFGNDSITGGAGLDQMYGGWHDDTLNADDGAGGDFLDCGPGNDLAIYNPGDIVASNCELKQLVL